MKFLEKDLEEIIYTSDRNLLEEKGINGLNFKSEHNYYLTMEGF